MGKLPMEPSRSFPEDKSPHDHSPEPLPKHTRKQHHGEHNVARSEHTPSHNDQPDSKGSHHFANPGFGHQEDPLGVRQPNAYRENFQPNEESGEGYEPGGGGPFGF